MTPTDVVNFYKTGYRFCKETKMSANTLTNWVNAGYIPFNSQKKIELITNGELKAIWDDKEPFVSRIKKSKAN